MKDVSALGTQSISLMNINSIAGGCDVWANSSQLGLELDEEEVAYCAGTTSATPEWAAQVRHDVACVGACSPCAVIYCQPCVRACVRACGVWVSYVREHMRACACACMRACVRTVVDVRAV